MTHTEPVTAPVTDPVIAPGTQRDGDPVIERAAASGLTWAELAQLPPTVDLMTAARVLGIGRTTAYTLARAGRFPCRLLRVAGTYRVPTADLMRTLGIDPPQPT